MKDIATLTADELRNLAIDFEHNWTDRARAICELHRRAAEYDKVDAAIADRGVPERDCRLPLPERVDNLIVELKNWRHECAVQSMREAVADGLIGKASKLIRFIPAPKGVNEQWSLDRDKWLNDVDRMLATPAKDAP